MRVVFILAEEPPGDLSEHRRSIRQRRGMREGDGLEEAIEHKWGRQEIDCYMPGPAE